MATDFGPKFAHLSESTLILRTGIPKQSALSQFIFHKITWQQLLCTVVYKFGEIQSSNPGDYNVSNFWNDMAEIGISHEISQNFLN